MSTLFEQFPNIITWPIQWGDQDLYGHVNNTIYIRWFESGRIAYLNQLGLDQLYTEQRIGPILAAVQCHFRKQLRYPDAVKIGSRVTKVGRTSFVMAHAIWSEKLGDLVAEGDSTIVTFDYNKQIPVPVPDQIRAAIALDTN